MNGFVTIPKSLIGKMVLFVTALFLLSPFSSAAQTVSLNSEPSNEFPIDLVWRADTYVPPDFGGKALPTRASTITVVALNPTQNSQNLEYTWLIKDFSSRIQGADKKGVGEDKFIFTSEDIIFNFVHRIKVTARNIRTGQTSSRQIEIRLVEPEAHLYGGESGVWGQRIKNRFVAEISGSRVVVAKPFYFNVGRLSDLDFSWVFDNQKLQGGFQPDLLTLSVSAQTVPQTEKALKLTVENKSPAGVLGERAFVSSKLLVIP